MPTHLTDSPPALPGGPGLTLRDARDLDRHRPDTAWGAMRLDWVQSIRGHLLSVSLIALPLMAAAMLFDLGGLVAAVYFPLLMGLDGLWARGEDWLGITKDRHSGTMRSVLPLSRRSVVTGRYLLLFATLAGAWAATAAVAILLGAASSRSTYDVLGLFTTTLVVFLVMELVSFPVIVRKGQGWGLAAALSTVAALIAVFFLFMWAGGTTAAASHPLLATLAGVATLALATYASWRATVRGYLTSDV